MPQTGTIGLGMVLVMGLSLEPSPPTKIKAYIIIGFKLIKVNFEFQ